MRPLLKNDWNRRILEAVRRSPENPFDELITRTPIFEAAMAMLHTRDDLHDVIEALRAIERYDLSDRLRTLQQRLDLPLAKITAITLERRGVLRK
jgi:hypothetical protein